MLDSRNCRFECAAHSHVTSSGVSALVGVVPFFGCHASRPCSECKQSRDCRHSIPHPDTSRACFSGAPVVDQWELARRALVRTVARRRLVLGLWAVPHPEVALSIWHCSHRYSQTLVEVDFFVDWLPRRASPTDSEEPSRLASDRDRRRLEGAMTRTD